MDNATCAVDGCERTPHAHAGYGMCSMHYSRLVRTGTLGPVGPSSPAPLSERLARKVEKSGDCWLWTSTLDRGGYGLLRVGRRNIRAHRAAYEVHIGPIPEGYEVDHLCRVPRCVNPAHLEAVTPEENLARRDAFHRQPGGLYDWETCTKGHPLSGDNLRVRPSRPSQKGCRACEKVHRETQKAKQRATRA